MVGSAVPQPFWLPLSEVGSTPPPHNLMATAASFHLGHLVRRRLTYHLRRRFLPQSSFKKLSALGNVTTLEDVWCECKKALEFDGIGFLQSVNDNLSSIYPTPLCFFSGGKGVEDSGSGGRSVPKIPNRNPFSGRKWTNVLLAVNILIYIAQMATQDKLLLWGAKINSLIDEGQLWRLATSSFLHANIGHLMVNCFSLNSVGPAVENISGPRRYLSLYFISAIASSATSYWLCENPAVGASGAIFGLVGSFGVFILRHRSMVRRGREDLLHLAQVIALNMVIGMLSEGIDNWGHLGGLVGGIVASYLLGPAWKYESTSRDGRRTFTDRAPIFNLLPIKREPKQLN